MKLRSLFFVLTLTVSLAACEQDGDSIVAPVAQSELSATQAGPNLTNAEALQLHFKIKPNQRGERFYRGKRGNLRAALSVTGPYSIRDVDLSSVRLEGVRVARHKRLDVIGPLPAGESTPVFRVNAGGPELPGSPVWREDSDFASSEWASVGFAASTTEEIDVSHASIPVGTPAALFSTERYDSSEPTDMEWEFPLDSGQYRVRLFFADTYPPTHVEGNRLFDIDIEGQTVATEYDIYAEVGAFAGIMEEFQTSVNDGGLSIDFKSLVQNANVCGFEIIEDDVQPQLGTDGSGGPDGIKDLVLGFKKKKLLASIV